MKNNRGQAITEMAIFGVIIIFTLGIMVSYIMRMNDQQYVEQEAFRRALEKACTYQGEEADTSGASVQLDLIEHRRYPQMYEKVMQASNEGVGRLKQFGTRKPQEISSEKPVGPQSVEASSSVFWAISKVDPKAAEDQQGGGGPGGGGSLAPENLLVLRANEDENTLKWDTGPTISDINYTYDTTIEETLTKKENESQINTEKTTKTQETITTDFGGEWTVTQGIYRDKDGQYKYSQDAMGENAERSRKWDQKD